MPPVQKLVAYSTITSPSAPARKQSVIVMITDCFLRLWELFNQTALDFTFAGRLFPYVFPYSVFLRVFFHNKIVELLHSVGTVLLHSLCHMAIYIQGELRGCVPQVCLHGFNVIAGG